MRKEPEDYQRGWRRGLQGKSIPQRGTYACKGPRLGHRDPDDGEERGQASQRIIEDGGKWQRRNETTKILRWKGTGSDHVVVACGRIFPPTEKPYLVLRHVRLCKDLGWLCVAWHAFISLTQAGFVQC